MAPHTILTSYLLVKCIQRLCQGTLRRFHPFRPFRHFHPLDNFITFTCLYSTSPSLNNTPLFSAYFRFFHPYPNFHFPLSFYSLFFYPLSSYSLFFPSLFLSRVPLFFHCSPFC